LLVNTYGENRVSGLCHCHAPLRQEARPLGSPILGVSLLIPTPFDAGMVTYMGRSVYGSATPLHIAQMHRTEFFVIYLVALQIPSFFITIADFFFYFSFTIDFIARQRARRAQRDTVLPFLPVQCRHCVETNRHNFFYFSIIIILTFSQLRHHSSLKSHRRYKKYN